MPKSRVLLRTAGAGDAEGLFAAIETSRILLKRRLRWVSGVRQAADCRSFIEESAAAAAHGERLVFVVVETRGGGLLGVAALQDMRAVPGLAEAALWIRADRRDNGYAAEAGRLLLSRAFRKDTLHRVYARIDPANRTARKVLKKLGFQYEGCLRREKRLNGRWINQECWGLLRPEWKR